MSDPRVFVVQSSLRVGRNGALRPKHDLTRARDHGELVEMLADSGGDPDLPSAVRELSGALADYDHERGDSVLPIGSPTLIGVACAIACRVSRGRLRLLRWNNREQRYEREEIELPSTIGERAA